MSEQLNVKELVDRQLKAWDEFKKTNEEVLKKGEAITSEKLAKINADLDKIGAEFRARMDAIEKKSLDVKNVDAGGSKSEEALAKKSAFYDWCRYGAVEPERRKFLQTSGERFSQKALSSSLDSGGGYLVPDEELPGILKGIIEFSPIRQLATVRATSTRSSQYKKRSGTFAAQWVAEQGTRSETTGYSVGNEEIPNHELYALVDVSLQTLEDNAYNLESELQSEFAEQFGAAEGAAFVSGNGGGKPEGCTVSASTTVRTAAATTIVADDVIKAFYDLKDGYARNATWLIKRSMIAKIRQFKDSSGQYLWVPAGFAGNTLIEGSPGAICGAQYMEAKDLEDDGTSGKNVALVADWKRAYVISDRVRLDVLRDPYSQSTAGNIRFIGRRRVGGQVVLGEAIVVLRT